MSSADAPHEKERESERERESGGRVATPSLGRATHENAMVVSRRRGRTVRGLSGHRIAAAPTQYEPGHPLARQVGRGSIPFSAGASSKDGTTTVERRGVDRRVEGI